MTKNTLRIVAAVLDTQSLTLYKEDGTTVVLNQGDKRIRKILDIATPALMHQGYADIDMSQENTYQKFEDKTNGGIKLFRVAKEKLKSLFGFGSSSDELEPKVIGKIPSDVQHTKDVVEDILQHAVPVASPEFHETTVAKQNNIVEQDGKTPGQSKESSASETIVAVVDGKVIPGMEKIKTQFSRASTGSPVGMENFLKRLSTVIEKRSHSVEDLLKFLERGDLPIADDGSILIYKVLNTRNGKFVDCHTELVEQWVGAYVCMDESLVDRNRNNECSNGLHVARRGYISGFSGDICVIAKLAPEDVIAVPAYDANKMRVCGYHIIKELPQDLFGLLRANRPITEMEHGKKILAQALAGNHIGKTHEVRITKQMGQGVQVTILNEAEAPSPVKLEPVIVLANPKDEGTAPVVNPKEVATVVEQLTKKQQAQKLFDDGDFEKLKDLKKVAKVSWEKLGVPDPDSLPKTKAIPFDRETKPITTKSVFEPSKVAALTSATHGEGSYKERIKKLLAIGLDKPVAQAILDLKKKAKQRWDVLGVSEDQVQEILSLTK